MQILCKLVPPIGAELSLKLKHPYLKIQKLNHPNITLVNKKILALNVRSILGYIEVAEPKYALSFFELALVFEI